MIYIEFGIEKHFIKQGFLLKLLTMIFPVANPDFENLIGEVVIWNLEFSDEESIPERELGLNSDGIVIVKMPFKKNVGYFTDNNMTLGDFRERFEVKATTKEIFEGRWNTFG